MPKKIINHCGFKTNKSNSNLHSVAFNDLTTGEVLALIHALMIARTISPVANDLSCFLRNALASVDKGSTEEMNIAQKFLDELNGDLNLVVMKKDELKQ